MDGRLDRIISQLLEVAKSKPGKYVELREDDIRFLVQSGREVVMGQAMLLELSPPLVVCGDIHGQYYDLLRLFEHCQYPPKANYLFLGDYVDRGRMNIETICLLLAYKIKYPESVFLLRGNHETSSVNKIYGFFDECKRRYTVRLWRMFSDLFNCLPVAALINEQIFCLHGGLSPELLDFDQIRKIQRPVEVPEEGLLCDLLWADPLDTVNGWARNDRGVSFTFNQAVVQTFCRSAKIQLVCRAHQVVEHGYQFFAKRQLITIFSAPNYCGEFDNSGGMLVVDENMLCNLVVLRPSQEPVFSEKPPRMERIRDAVMKQ